MAALRLAAAAFSLALGLLASLVGAYCLAAVVGTLVLVGGEAATGDERTRRAYVFATPVHVDIILPIADDVADWRPLVRSRAFPGGAAERQLLADTASHVAIGWGARSFYFNVKYLSDLRPGHALDAVWDDGLIHVSALGEPDGKGVIPVDLTEAGYTNLVAELSEGFAATEDGGAIPVPGESYAGNDGFFAARADYSLIRTCNVWAAQVLRAAGVRVPLWSPFAGGLERALLKGLSAR